MSTYTDPNDFLLAGGSPAAKFPQIGATVKGTIEHMEVSQQTDFTTSKPKYYDDGKPMMQLVITLATDERDPTNDNDDGTRRLFVKGQMLAAVRSAVKQTGSQLLQGGTLVVKYVNDRPSERPGMNPAKQYEAAYKPPVGNQSQVDGLLANPGPSANDLL